MIYHSTLSTFTIYPLANWQFVPEHQADFSWNLSNPQLLRYSHSDIIVIIVNHIWSYRSYSYVHFLEAIYFHFHQPMAIYIYISHTHIYIYICVWYTYTYTLYMCIYYISHATMRSSAYRSAKRPCIRSPCAASGSPSASPRPRRCRRRRLRPAKRRVFSGENGGFSPGKMVGLKVLTMEDAGFYMVF